MEDHMRRAERFLDLSAKRHARQSATVLPATLVKVRRPERHLVELVAQSETDQQSRGVRSDVDTGAEFGEPARLLIDPDIEAGPQQADRSGESADAAADNRDGRVSGGHSGDYSEFRGDVFSAISELCSSRSDRAPARHATRLPRTWS